MHIWITVLLNALAAAMVVVCAVRWLQSCGAKKSAHLFLRDTAATAGWGKIPAMKLLRVFLFGIGIRLLLYAAGYLYLVLTEQAVPENLFLVFNKWDAYHYVHLIEQGYDGYRENGEHLFLVFFPLFVWLVRPFALIFGNTYVVGAVFSTVCFACGCCFLYKLAHGIYGERAAGYAVLFSSLFPFSFFFGSSMTEGLFFLTTTAAVYCAMRHRWLGFGIWGILAALTRMTGVLVMIPAFLELLRRHQPLLKDHGRGLRVKKLFQRGLLALLPLLGTLVYLLLNQLVDQDPFAFTRHQEHWHQRGMWFTDVLKYVFEYLIMYNGTVLGGAVWYPTLIIFVLFFLLLILACLRKLAPGSLFLYALTYLLVNYSLSWLLSAGRYMSCGFVFFLLLAVCVEKRPAAASGILAAEAVLLGVYMAAYLSGAPVM